MIQKNKEAEKKMNHCTVRAILTENYKGPLQQSLNTHRDPSMEMDDRAPGL